LNTHCAINPMLVQSAADVAARRVNIQKEFNKSSSGKFLGKMRGYEERMLAEVHARKSAQKTLDMLSHSVDSSAKMIDNIASDVAEWTPDELCRVNED
jgi:hypothetical protein